MLPGEPLPGPDMFRGPAPAWLAARLRAAGSVFAKEEAQILWEAAASPAELERLAGRRADGVPLEHLVGWAAFHGLRIAVAPGVFVPRLRTELLVREAAAVLWAADPAAAVVLDLCCGSGAIGAALAREFPRAQIHAADIDPAAAACAAANLDGLGRVHRGDLFDALPAGLRGRITVITANAPYVPTDAIAFMPAEARLFEPETALDGGADGLDIQRRIAALAPAWLAPGGQLFLETSPGQERESLRILRSHGFTARAVRAPELEAVVAAGTLPKTGTLPKAGDRG